LTLPDTAPVANPGSASNIIGKITSGALPKRSKSAGVRSPNCFNSGFAFATSWRKGIPGIITCQNAALALPLVFDPGDKWDYGINIDWVGKAVERVSRQRLGDYFAEHLFGPIGMKDTGFKLSHEQRTRLAGMHARDDAGTLGRMEFEVSQEPEFQMGGGGLYGTASDYLAFQRLFLNEGRANGWSVLKPETVRLMFENGIGDLNVQPLKTAVPHLSHDAECSSPA